MQMTIQNKESEVRRILEEIRTTEYSTIQSIHLLLEYGFRLASYQAFTGEAKAEAKQILHKKRQQYLELAMESYKNAPTTIIKDYISDLAANEHGYLELCDRANSACTHTMDLIRTAISSLRQEMVTATYSDSLKRMEIQNRS